MYMSTSSDGSILFRLVLCSKATLTAAFGPKCGKNRAQVLCFVNWHRAWPTKIEHSFRKFANPELKIPQPT